MECPSCYELYDEGEKCPRNLPCGHTYCEHCLKKILALKKKIECPICRAKISPTVPISQLSKNYIAAELAMKQREIQKKLLLCDAHKEPMKIFCETCQTNVCPGCIIDHSGHKFLKQEHSATLLKERTSNLNEQIVKKLEEIKQEQDAFEKKKNKDIKQKNDQLKAIDEEFDRIIKKLNDRRALLKANYETHVNEEISAADKDIAKRTATMDKFLKLQSEVAKLTEKFENTKVIQGNELIRSVEDIEESFNMETKNLANTRPQYVVQIPKVLFDPIIYQEFAQIGFMSKSISSPKICFFGEKNKILIYNIEKEEWKLQFLPQYPNIEFNYYSSACTLPSGDILVTGGGISNAVYLFSLSKMLPIHKKPMNQARKEHASVYLNNFVYVLGGYDGTSNAFLNSCERYDLEKDEWRPIDPMLIAKCAFGACSMDNRYIFVVGGYDGIARLNTIERYDTETQKWDMLKITLHEPLSNSACFSDLDNNLTILGGGYNHGFSLEVWTLDVEKFKWKEGPQMNDGRDLRNKLAIFGGFAYAVGGNSCKGEKFSLTKREWNPLFSYQHLVNDNLDSWSCAMAYEISGRSDTNKNVNVYQNYHYDEAYDADIMSEEHDSSLFEDWGENYSYV